MCKHVYMHTCIHTLIFQDILYMLTSMHVQKYICTCKQQIWTYVSVYVYIYTYTYGNMHIRRNLKQPMKKYISHMYFCRYANNISKYLNMYLGQRKGIHVRSCKYATMQLCVSACLAGCLTVCLYAYMHSSMLVFMCTSCVHIMYTWYSCDVSVGTK